MQVLAIKWTNKRRRMPKRLRDRFGVLVHASTTHECSESSAPASVHMLISLTRSSTPDESPKQTAEALQEKDVMPLNMLNGYCSLSVHTQIFLRTFLSTIQP